VPLLALAALGGCAVAPWQSSNIQRATEGPPASEIYNFRFVRSYGRVPTFDETFAWRDELDGRITEYFVRHPEVARSIRSQQFRRDRRVTVGMSKEEVVVLCGTPDGTSTDPAVMAQGAGQFWPDMQARVRELWSYPGGWRLYFDGDRLVDVTVEGKPPIE
jgi:hypothetical protein